MLIGTRAYGLLWKRKKEKGTGPLKLLRGSINSIEVTRRSGADWHPHIHTIATVARGWRVEVDELRPEWRKLTGGNVNIKPLKNGRKGLREAFKYATKPQDVRRGKIDSEAIWWRFLSYLALKRRRLIRAYGCYHGNQAAELEDLSADQLGHDLDGYDYIDWLAFWSEDAAHYQLTRLGK
jgi:hypothetical protein